MDEFTASENTTEVADQLIDDTGIEGQELSSLQDDMGNKAEVVEPQERSTQTPEQNAAFAKLRREAEEAKRALKERDEWVNSNFGEQGITSWEEYTKAVNEATQKRQEAYYKQKENELQGQGYDVNAIREIMRLDPEYQQLKQQNQLLQDQMKQEQQRQLQSKLEQEIINDHKSLKEEYGDLVPDLDKLDESTIKRMQKGYSLADAWLVSNKQSVMQNASKAAKQKTLNNLNSKAHLKTEGDGANEGNDIHVPTETLQMYLDQGMSKKDAIAFHKKLYG